MIAATMNPRTNRMVGLCALTTIITIVAACGPLFGPGLRDPGGARPRPTTTTTSLPVPGAGTVGYLGCSNTWMAVSGYHDVNGTGHLWPTLPTYGGGSLDQWTDPASHYWASFDAQQATTPATAIWWHLCLHPGTTLTQAQTVLSILHSKAGGVPVYVSAMATYADPNECPIADPATSRTILNGLVAQGLVKNGPSLTPLSRANTTDGCHPDQTTRDADGQSLVTFFK